MSSVIWWIRRDLRLRDNPALHAAVSSGKEVIPVFVIDPKLINSNNTSRNRLGFLWASLKYLDNNLRSRGSGLIIRSGEPNKELQKLFYESQAKAIFAETDFSPYARFRDNEISRNMPLQLLGGSCISHPELVLKPDGQPYVIFSAYKRRWKDLNHPMDWLPNPAPEQIQSPKHIQSEPLPRDPAYYAGSIFEPGELAAQKRLAAFTKGSNPGIFDYTEGRNRMDLEGTSKISPYLRFGMLSAREAAFAAFQAHESARDDRGRKSAETWLDELIWREFYISILYHFPEVIKNSFRPELQNIPWRNDKDEFSAWCQGRTGYPVVDAAMRQLAEIGWMHNRARMIVASFLIKDLLIDWRWGERWFMQHLLDGDLAANNGGWQWTAGTGTDAAPYFRIFNPVLQSKKFDPQGRYIHRWIPELRRMPIKYIHTPWELPSDIQTGIGCRIGKEFPAPIIEHASARQRTLQAYKLTRNLSARETV